MSDPADPFLTQTLLLRRLGDSSDVESWAEFCELYRPLIMRFARSSGLREEDADDLVQDLLGVRLRPALAEFRFERSRGRFRTWLWQVVRNGVLERQRRAGAERRARERLEHELRAGGAVEVAATDDELSGEWERAHRRRVLEFALAKVRGSSRATTWACFEQQFMKGAAGADVARELGLTEQAVFTNAHRVAARVRETCWQYDEDFAEERTSEADR